MLKNLEKHVVTNSMRDKIFLFYGEPGTRKTTVAMGDKEKTLLAAFEVGYKFIPDIYVLKIANWVTFKQMIYELADPDIKEIYSTIVIDTVGLAYKNCVAYICSQAGVKNIGDIPYGRGYTDAKNEFEKLINSIPQMGYGLILIAHSDEMSDEKTVSVKVDIDKRPAAIIKGLADFILYARKEKSEKNPEETTVYAYSETTSEKIEVKSRARFFPRKFEFTYENLVAALSHAIEKQNEFFGTVSKAEADFSLYEEDKIDVEKLKKEIIALATPLRDTVYADKLTAILTAHLRGIRVSEATIANLASLFAIKDELIELRKGM